MRLEEISEKHTATDEFMRAVSSLFKPAHVAEIFCPEVHEDGA